MTCLASISCAYSSAENMLRRARIQEAETARITGVLGGVRSVARSLMDSSDFRDGENVARASVDAFVMIGCFNS